MKTKLTAILIIFLSSFAFSSCSEEEITPLQTTSGPQADGLGEDDEVF